MESFVPQTWFLSEVEQDIGKTARKKAGKELQQGNQKEKDQILDLEEEKLQNLSN